MVYRKRSGGLLMALIAIAAGMGGELHIAVPGLGFMAMLDIVSYAIAVPVLLMFWGRMGKSMRRSLMWAFAWTIAAMAANAFNFIQGRYWLKCVAVVSSSWAIMAASYLLLRKYPMGYLWYLVGAGLGGWIALHYFRNGSLEGFATQGELGEFSGLDNLMDKQIYPSVARGLLYGCVLPFFLWWKKMPIFIVLVATMMTGFWLLFHGGSRSNFGMFCAAAGAGFVVAYGARTYRRLVKNPFMMCLCAGVAVAVLFGGYKFMANSGMMGDAEKRKYEQEFKYGQGAIEGRAGFGRACELAADSLGLGKGGHLRCHSVMANSLACEGLVGFLFWIYFYMQLLWWASRRMPYSGKYTAFIVLMMMAAAWDVFGSPFGTRHKFFVFMAFAALCRDNKYYGVGEIFDEKLLQAREK